MVTTKSILEQIDDYVREEGFELPVFEKVSLRLQSLLHSDDFDIKDVEKLILHDQVLAGGVLRAANSSFFGGLKEITTIKDAIVRLGTRQVADLVILAAEGNKYQARDTELNKLVKHLWQHAVACAMGGQWLARKLNYHDKATEVFIGGLIHDIGKLFLLKVIDQLQVSSQQNFNLSYDLGQELIDVLHAEKGYELLKKWNIPDVYCRIARDHHDDMIDPGSTIMMIVRVADKACVKLGIGSRHDPSIELATLPAAVNLRMKEILLAEFEIMLEDAIRIA